MGQREMKPFMVSKGEIEDYQFTKAQIKAYDALIKASKRCEKAGLSLLAKQDSLYAYPTKFYMNNMMTTSGEAPTLKFIKVPKLMGADICDSGADDTEFIPDKYIKN